MTRLTKAAFAVELECSEATLRRVIERLHLVGKPLDDLGELKVALCAELQQIGIIPSRSVEIVAGLHSEVMYLAGDSARKCWLVATDQHQFVPTTERHLDAILSNWPCATVVSLHELARRAGERLAGMKARLAQKEAA